MQLVMPDISPQSQEADQQPLESFQHVLGNIVPKTDKVSDTAKQFEALVIGQLLKSAREASQGGWLGTGDDQTGQLALEMAEQGLAQALAARGGIGIAKMVTPLLRRDEAKAANSASSNLPVSAVPSKDSQR
jgi:Rod binding domain-containing protein